MIYFIRESTVQRVAATGGRPESVTAPIEGGLQRFPHTLPAGRGLLLTLPGGSPF